MAVVISDTSPINYLVLIGEIDVLPRLYGKVLIPDAVLSELRDAGSPAAVARGPLCCRRGLNWFSSTAEVLRHLPWIPENLRRLPTLSLPEQTRFCCWMMLQAGLKRHDWACRAPELWALSVLHTKKGCLSWSRRRTS